MSPLLLYILLLRVFWFLLLSSYQPLSSSHHRSPEILFGLPYSRGIDAWGVCCLLASLYPHDDLFYASSTYGIVSHNPGQQSKAHHSCQLSMPSVCRGDELSRFWVNPKTTCSVRGSTQENSSQRWNHLKASLGS